METLYGMKNKMEKIKTQLNELSQIDFVDLPDIYKLYGTNDHESSMNELRYLKMKQQLKIEKISRQLDLLRG